jgi:hypothetical protein
MPEAVLRRIAAGALEPLYLVSGDRVVAEPAAERIARAAAERIGCEVDVQRRPAELAPVLADLRTLSLFGGGKVVMVVESEILADARDAADLIDAAGEALPLASGELARGDRRGAGRLLQALNLFDIDPHVGTPEAAVSRLPEWALQGGSGYRRKSRNRPRGKRQVEELRGGLGVLLAAARAAELEGWAETEVAELAQIVGGGLPPNHVLILVEHAVAEDHPLVRRLAERGAWVRSGTIGSNKKGEWEGLGPLKAQLESDTGVTIRPDALDELTRRTLQREDDRGGGARVNSTERLAGEFRKLASLAGEGGTIDRALVEDAVDDRGDEDKWKILDAIGEGRAADALVRIDRYLAAAEDPIGAQLAFFGLLAGFAKLLTEVAGVARLAGVPRGERSYNRFKSQMAPRLKAKLGPVDNPLAKVHEFRLHRAYLAASRLPPELLARLPRHALEAELALKGGSRRPRAVLADFVAHLAGEPVGLPGVRR